MDLKITVKYNEAFTLIKTLVNPGENDELVWLLHVDKSRVWIGKGEANGVDEVDDENDDEPLISFERIDGLIICWFDQ